MAIRLDHVSKHFGDKQVFSDLSLTLPEKGTVAFCGASGVGKTTLLRLICGLEVPDSGHISGNELRFTALFQENRLIETRSVLWNLHLVCKKGIDKTELLRHLSLVGLENEADTVVADLSGGMARRAALVRAILAEGDVLLLDEPFKGLDDETRLAAVDYVKTQASGRLILLVSHDARDAGDLDASLWIRIAEGKAWTL